MQRVLRAEVQESLADWILADAVGITQGAALDAVRNRPPRLAEVRRPVDEGIAVVDLMEIDRENRRKSFANSRNRRLESDRGICVLLCGSRPVSTSRH